MAERGNEEFLTKLGLTGTQAKVYLSLAKFGNESVSIKKVANISRLDRANLYRTMARLQEIGLVELLLGNPNTYRALSIKDALQLLLKKKEKEYNDFLETWKKMKKIKVSNLESIEINEGSFQITPAKEGQAVILRRAFLSAQTSNDGILNLSHFEKTMLANAEDDLFKLSMARGVNFRYIIYCDLKNKEAKILKLTNQFFGKLKGKIQIRFIYDPPDAIFSILDRKEVLMHIHPLPDWVGTPCLQSTNVCFVGVTQRYFDELWTKAQMPTTDAADSHTKASKTDPI
jgi:DNA-binding MarR family transcriptional regulator